ncbi:hypothetical protein Taro_024365 [Colocasia esculenta]|uniref:Protein kinase domain-containing protein n=1 Tax=Colocasia esculenta TaxID=4460 RepID=A0A843VB51_COLES|nr:hypothetical protein [Colocasia esculenta]
MIFAPSNRFFSGGRSPQEQRRGGSTLASAAAPSIRLSWNGRKPNGAVGGGAFCARSALVTNPDDFEVGRFLGSYGFMNVTRQSHLHGKIGISNLCYSSFQTGAIPGGGRLEELNLGYSSEDIERLRVQDVGEGQVKIRLYEGRIVQGPLRGTQIVFKVYPGQRAGGIEADMMAANELRAHAFLQGETGRICQNIQILLGGFETKTGEQWLAFRKDGIYSAADYAKVMSEDVSKYQTGGQRSWNPFEWEQKIRWRRKFVIKLLKGAMNGLAYMHDNDRLHQSLGPASVVLNTIIERDVAYLVPHLRDLAFSVDIRYSSLDTGPRSLSEGLWRRASSAGAFTLLEKRAFGIADDIYEAGLLFAYLAFVPFCEAGVMDGLSLQRLFEGTFKLDLAAAREAGCTRPEPAELEPDWSGSKQPLPLHFYGDAMYPHDVYMYCLADDRLTEAVKFLDLDDCAGWQLLQAMLNPDYRQRPIAEAVLNHRFMTGAVP